MSRVLYIMVIVLGVASCKLQAPPGYFQQGLDSSVTQVYKTPELIIQKGDRLGIVFYSDNPEATAIYNQLAGSAVPSPTLALQKGVRESLSKSAGQTDGGGYLVDQDGYIRIHGIGTLKAEGQTRASLEKRLTDTIKAMGTLSNPYCVVQFMGMRITVLGEVRNPGVYQSNSERTTIYEALGMAGDVMLSGRKEEVILVREEKGERTYTKLDLTKPNTVELPQLYLKQNDLIVVQANKFQQNPTEFRRQQYVNIALAASSILVIFLNLIFK